MENFDWTQFTRKIAVQTSKEVVYKAWTLPAELEKWFLSDASFFDAHDKKKPKTVSIEKNDTYEWKWHLYPMTEKGRVTIADGENHLQFTFAGTCTVDVILEEFEGKTIVALTQKNIPTDDASKKEIRLGCDHGWSFYLVNLKSVHEGGLDLRNKDPNLKPMLNN